MMIPRERILFVPANKHEFASRSDKFRTNTVDKFGYKLYPEIIRPKETDMAIQTQQLSASLPRFASLFRSADAKGSAEWQIIQWHGRDPAVVTPDDVIRPERLTDDEETRPNRFNSRTPALRYSKMHVRRLHPLAQETEHWGVWRWSENGTAHYQSVAPIQEHSAARHATVVREQKGEAYSGMARVSAETNRRLREIAAEDNTTLQSVLEAAVKEYYANWFFRRADNAYNVLRQNEQRWSQEMYERKSLDETMLDGIDSDEVWHNDRTVHATQTKAGKCG
jgi:hypothetical protein